MDPWIIPPVERARHVEQFKSLNPVGGFVTGDQARGFLMQSQLPLPVLGQIWSLADVNCDGKMDMNEFSVACKLITNKLKGMEVPPTLPPSLRLVISTGSNTATPVISPSGSLTGIASPTLPPVLPGSGYTTPPVAASQPADPWTIQSHERARHQDQFRSLNPVGGYVTGEQAKGFMCQSQLPGAVLAAVWNLADANCDGKMDINEFSVACKLITMKLQGFEVPTVLPQSLKNVLAASASSTPTLVSPTSMGPSFEDKRKENYDKGQAELERRRKAIADMQQREREERDRREREEMDKREKLRLEQERKKMEEIEMKMAMQREMEERKREELRKAEELKENARKEAERQRMNEVQDAKRQELMMRREKEQELLLKMKSENTNLGLELQGLTDKVKELGVKITETRVGVSGVKSEIDGMRAKRDTYMNEVATLKAKLKEQNQRILNAEKEKARLDKLSSEKEVRHLNLKQVREKLNTLKEELDKKKHDSDESTAELDELKSTLSTLIETCKTVYEDYKDKREQVVQLRKKHHQTFDYNAAWSTGPAEDFAPPESEVLFYRALYDFESRNPDELSFTAGEIITKDTSANPDPGWLAGIIEDRSGLFPEAFVEAYDPDAAGYDAADTGYAADAGFAAEEPVAVPIAEVAAEEYAGEYYVAVYPYDSAEPGDLSFQIGETILVTHAEGEWWSGSIGADRTGVFPGNFVSKPDVTAESEALPAETAYVDEASVLPDEPSKTQLEPYEEAELKREMSEIIQQNQAAIPKSPKTVKSGKRYEIATVLANYQPSGAGQLALTRGMLVTVRKKSPSGWWEGELQAKGKKREIGWFPGSYAKILGPGGASSRGGSSRTTPIPFDDMPDETAPVFYGSESGDGDGRSSSAAGIAGEQVIALYPYTAQNTDELTFVKDDVITIISKDEPDWWRGQLGSTVGLFPTNYVEPLGTYTNGHVKQDSNGWGYQLQPSTPTFRESSPQFTETLQEGSHRQEAIRELIETEEAYLTDLFIVKECFIDPLLISGHMKLEDVNEVFVNWDDLLECSNRLLMAFKVRWKSFGRIQIVGDILTQQLPTMQIYIRFCSTNNKALAFLQAKITKSATFAKFVQNLSMNPKLKTKNLPLSTYLLKPMQRITRYPLLIQKILQATPDAHPDRRDLEEAFSKAEELCNMVNEGVRETENSDCLEWIQQRISLDPQEERIVFNSLTNCVGPRKFIHHGSLKKVKSGKDVVGFLFNDFLLLTLPNKVVGRINFAERNQSLRFKVYRKPILLQDMEIVDGNEENEVVINNMLFSCAGVNEKRLWVNKLQEAKRSYIRTEKQYKSNQRSRKSDPYCEVSLGNEVKKTRAIRETLNPKWNEPMQFTVRDLKNDIVSIAVYDKDLFSPNQFMGRTEIRIAAIHEAMQSRKTPWTTKFALQEVKQGAVVVKFHLQLFNE